ncbi:MAG: heavy metal translocating P-type ATPase [Acidiferrobacterales bacterium]
MKTSVIEVHNMLSVLTVDDVEKRIGKVPGVESVTVNHAAGNATVRYDETRLEVADIKAIMHQRAHQAARESRPRNNKHKSARNRAAVPMPEAAPDTSSTAPAGEARPVAPGAATSAVVTKDGHERNAAQGAPPSLPAAQTPKASAYAPIPAVPQIDKNKSQAVPDAMPSAPVATTPKAASISPAAVPVPTAPAVNENKGPATPGARPSTPAAPVHGFLARIKGILPNILAASRVKKPNADGISNPPSKPVAGGESNLAPTPPTVTTSPDAPAGAVEDAPAGGLTSDEARRRLEKSGPNTMPDTALHPLRRALAKFWAPVPWMLETTILLELVLGKYVEAAIIAGLLVFNAALGFLQEGRAQATLAALKSRLALNAPVRRDSVWKIIPAAELVSGDVVKLSLGAVVAADVRLTEGSVLLDQSMLTGESVPIEAGPGVQTYAGALVRRGEAVAEVTKTGARTKFGRTAELVRSAHVVSSQQKAVLRVVRNLALFNGVLIAMLVAYAYDISMPSAQIISLVLTAVLASIPVALPATFTLAAAIGAQVLAKLGILPTRLSAVDEAASMDVLCADKTGTLTNNELKVTSVRPMPGFDEAQVVGMAALASSEGGQDPVDGAIRAAAVHSTAPSLPKLNKFVPFDPATKMSGATVTDSSGATLRIVKGAFATVASLTQALPRASAAANELEAQGFRVLAVAVGPSAAMKLAGIIALSDPPRSDSAALITELHTLGVSTVMVTGDAPATAAIVAHAVGLEGAVSSPGPIPDVVRAGEFAVFAGVLPEGKYKLVQAFQKGGHTVGMCGDGANDAPALRQAQMGIAVSTATDVAKSAAGIVLTKPGLVGIVAAVKEGRVTFQRILTYTLNTVIKKMVTVLFLAVGLVMTGHAILTPMLMVIIMVTGDFLTMSLTTDNVQASPLPNAWRIGRLTIAGAIVGLCLLAFCTAVLAFGHFSMGLGTAALETLALVALVFGSQTTVYAIRDRRRLWSRASLWLNLSSLANVLIISTLAVSGILMVPLPILLVAGTLGVAIGFGLILDVVKIPIFRRLKIA